MAVLKLIANALSVRPRTQTEIIELTGLCNSTVSRWMRFLNVSTKTSKAVVYICEWKRTGTRGNWSAVWAWGFNLSNTPKPKPLTSGQYSKRWRMKKLKASSNSVTQTEKGIIYVSQ